MPARDSRETESELRRLRARAYGPDADIDRDPVALARLSELEEAHLRERAAAIEPLSGATAPRDVPASSQGADTTSTDVLIDEAVPLPGADFMRREAMSRSRRIAIAAVASVGVAAVASALTWLGGPHPDATLRVVEGSTPDRIMAMLAFLNQQHAAGTLRQHESHLGLEPWSYVDQRGLQCLMIVEPKEGPLDNQCMPPGVDVFADLAALPYFADDFAQELTPGSVVRFHLRESAVEVFFFPAPN